jgi:hypothetical protein
MSNQTITRSQIYMFNFILKIKNRYNFKTYQKQNLIYTKLEFSKFTIQDLTTVIAVGIKYITVKSLLKKKQ